MPWRLISLLPVGGRGRPLPITRDRLVLPNIIKVLQSEKDQFENAKDLNGVVGIQSDKVQLIKKKEKKLNLSNKENLEIVCEKSTHSIKTTPKDTSATVASIKSIDNCRKRRHSSDSIICKDNILKDDLSKTNGDSNLSNNKIDRPQVTLPLCLHDAKNVKSSTSSLLEIPVIKEKLPANDEKKLSLCAPSSQSESKTKRKSFENTGKNLSTKSKIEKKSPHIISTTKRNSLVKTELSSAPTAPTSVEPKEKNLSTKDKGKDISSSAISTHVESVLKAKNPFNSRKDLINGLGGVRKCVEQNRKQIESKIIEISNSIQKKLIKDKKSGIGLDNHKNVKNKEVKKKDDINEILTPDNLFPRLMSIEEEKRRDTNIYNSFFPESKPRNDKSIPELKPIHNSGIPESKPLHYSGIPFEQLLLSTIPIAIPTSLRFNDPKYIETLEEKELFVILEHIPLNAQEELEELIASYGTITIFLTEEDLNGKEKIGLLKMSDPFECEFVVSCLDGYVWSDLRMVARKAVDIL